MHYFLNAVTHHYADFSGRARRREYWLFVLCSSVIQVVALIADFILATPTLQAGWVSYGLLYLLCALTLFLPSWAVAVRRMHDVGKSGWFFAVSLIPVAGFIWILVLLCTDSQRGTNAYGPNPKEAPARAARADAGIHRQAPRTADSGSGTFVAESRPSPVPPGRAGYIVHGRTGDGSPVHFEVSGNFLAHEGGVIGRSRQGATLVVEDPTLSRRHARLLGGQDSIYIEDLGSTNGTKVNGVPLRPHSRAAVGPGDTIDLGAVRVRVDTDSSSV